MTLIRYILKTTLLLLLICNTTFGFTIKNKINKELDVTQIQYFEDKSQKVEINDFIKLNSTYNFSPLGENNKNLGFSKSTHWLKFSIKNDSKRNKVYLFHIENPGIDDIKYYLVRNDSVIHDVQTGNNFAHSTRHVKSNNFIFKLYIPANQERTFFFRIQNNKHLRLPLKLKSLSIGEDDTFKTHSLTIFLGYVLFAFIFNLLLFIGIRDKSYLLLCIFTISFTLLLLTMEGFTFQYLWPNSPKITGWVLLFSIVTSIVSIFIFVLDFFKFKKLRKILRYNLIFVFAFLLIWNLLPSSISELGALGGNILIFILTLSILTLSFIGYLKNRNEHNLIFLLSFIVLILGIIVFLFRNFGMLPEVLLTQNSVKIGFVSQITLISIATIFKFKNVMNEANLFLEKKVEERTNEISIKNDKLQEQNKQIVNQFNEIQQSIHYAKRIQNAILPHDNKFSGLFKEHMILYKPRDIVSGDFYWVVTESDNKTYIAAADCTGHGVPGAFLSMLGMSFLNQIVASNHDIKPSEVLNNLRDLFAKTLNNNSSDGTLTRDSMDISICLFNHAKKELEYAGAYNSILLIRDENLTELKVDRFSLENDTTSEVKNYENFVYPLQDNDRIYMFSDGYHDQFGGSKNKRLTKKQFKNILLETSNLPLREQKTVLNNFILEWQGDEAQIDDILILGILV